MISMAAPDLHTHSNTVPLGPSRSQRDAAVARARRLNVATIGWNSIEGFVAVAAGIAASSVSLVGFGFDSAIEVSAALILTWRLAQERKDGCTQQSDRRATKAIAISFVILATYVAVEATRDLATGAEPDASAPGVVLAALRWSSCRAWHEPRPASRQSSGQPPPPPTPPKPTCAPCSQPSCSSA